MNDFEKILLSLFLAYIATIIFNTLYRRVCFVINTAKENHRVLNGYKKQLDSKEITEEEYKRKVKEFTEKSKTGEMD